MKKILVLSVVALLGASLGSCGVSGSKKLSTNLDTLSYAFGLTQLAPNVKFADTTFSISPEIAIAAIRDFQKDAARMTPEEAMAFIQNYFSVTLPAENLIKAEAFLAEVAAGPNVKKTESGLYYEIIEEGGEKATTDADTVRVIYTGTLPNGREFDSTAQRGTETDEFSLNQVIPAWTEGMKLVGEGGKVKLYAHPDLAYGAQGAGQAIGPNEALVFEVEVVEVRPAVAVEAPAAQ